MSAERHSRRCLNVIALVKGDERYVWTYDDEPESLQSLYHGLGMLAADQELSFSWYDAAVVSQRLRAVHKET